MSLHGFLATRGTRRGRKHEQRDLSPPEIDTTGPTGGRIGIRETVDHDWTTNVGDAVFVAIDQPHMKGAIFGAATIWGECEGVDAVFECRNWSNPDVRPGSASQSNQDSAHPVRAWVRTVIYFGFDVRAPGMEAERRIGSIRELRRRRLCRLRGRWRRWWRRWLGRRWLGRYARRWTCCRLSGRRPGRRWFGRRRKGRQCQRGKRRERGARSARGCCRRLLRHLDDIRGLTGEHRCKEHRSKDKPHPPRIQTHWGDSPARFAQHVATRRHSAWRARGLYHKADSEQTRHGTMPGLLPSGRSHAQKCWRRRPANRLRRGSESVYIAHPSWRVSVFVGYADPCPIGGDGVSLLQGYKVTGLRAFGAGSHQVEASNRAISRTVKIASLFSLAPLNQRS